MGCEGSLRALGRGGRPRRGFVHLYAGLLRRECYGAVLQYETGNAGIAMFSGLVKHTVVVAQAQEFFQILHVGADIDDFVTVISLNLLVNGNTVRTSAHSINLYHHLVFNSDFILLIVMVS